MIFSMKIRGILFLACTVLGILACGKKEAEYISEEKMGKILFELHLADVLADADGGSLAFRNVRRNDQYDEILATFEIDRETFYRSYEHFIDNPAKMDSVYVRLITKMDKRMEIARDRQYDSQKDRTKWKKKRDSLKAITPKVLEERSKK